MNIKKLLSKKEPVDENHVRIYEEAAQQTYLRLLNEFCRMDLWLEIIPKDLTQMRKMFERADLEAFDLIPFDTISYKTILNLTSDTIQRRQQASQNGSASENLEYLATASTLGPTCTILLEDELCLDCIFRSLIDLSLRGNATPNWYKAPNALTEISNNYTVLEGLNFKPIYQIEYIHEVIRLVLCLLTAVDSTKLSFKAQHNFQIWWTFFNDVWDEYKRYEKWCGIVEKELLKNPHYRWESLFILDDIWKYSSGNYETYLNNVFNSIVELDITKEKAYELCMERSREFLTNTTVSNKKAHKMNLF